MFCKNRFFIYLATLTFACLLFSCGKKDQLQPIKDDQKAGTVNGGTVLEPVTFDYDGTGDILVRTQI